MNLGFEPIRNCSTKSGFIKASKSVMRENTELSCWEKRFFLNDNSAENKSLKNYIMNTGTDF